MMYRADDTGYSLRVLLVIFIGVLLTVVLLAGTWFSASRFGAYLEDELRIQTQDAATALGVAVSVLEREGQVRRLVDTVFDSGAYTRIELVRADGSLRHSREVETGPPPVPEWFRWWADLPSPLGEAAVVDGWEPAGSVQVHADPVPALVRLWHSFLVGLAWSGALLVVSLWLVWRCAGRLLAPLRQMENQAQALEANDFTARTDPPRSRELGRVARALNSMARNLGETFERQIGLISELEHRNRRDPVTGLRTREAFDQALAAELHSRESAAGGVVAVFRPRGFQSFNERHGRARGNTVLAECGAALLDFESHHEGVMTARGQGADLLVCITGVEPVEADAWLQELVEQLSTRYSTCSVPDQGVFQAGVTRVELELDVGALLARADQGLATAAASGEPLLCWGHALAAPVKGAGDWLEAIDAALASGDMALAWQALHDMDGSVLMTQALGRLKLAGRWEAAAHFLPHLERSGRTPAFDRLVIERVLSGERVTPDSSVAVSVGLASLVDDSFMHWLAMRLEAAGDQVRGLWLVVPERALRVQPTAVALLADTASRVGAGLMVDHFGSGGVSFGYLGRYAIQAVRISREYIRDLHQRREARFFLSNIAPVLRAQGIRVFVSGVEVEGEWSVVRELPVDGVMGFYFSRPQEPEEGG
ncbi:EAL domain-containing protein [Vreelandella utahensis]|uniref:EAL domain-containing protein n=1 Tax=Vreelandella halophila TaxID=86177 RepID=UPI000987B542|nr:EAL domain-containing protein [Halomonas utahensis]